MKFQPHRVFSRGLLLAACLSAVSLAQQPPDAPVQAGPIAIVPIDPSGSVSGALQVSQGKAIIASSGAITSGAKPTDVILPRRGTLRVCASTSVKLAADTSVPAGETPGLMMALDHGAIEASYAAGRNSDVLLTPDFRILIGGPGAVDVKVRLGDHGDTCVDNPGVNAPYVLVSSVFDGGAYRVQPGQRVMFQHGSLQEVVDQEKEPCGCPPAPRPGSNDFPLAESAGLVPQSLPPVQPAPKPDSSTASSTIIEPLVYQAPAAPEPAASAATATPAPAQPPAQAAQTTKPPAPAKKHPGFFHRVGSFFRRIFGAEQG
ncbi:MAG TPA: hypothetical protein VG267_09060 [Terracidiphilus sp.]|jgi:hypothetical protein|nr:hypothetical protein [Terracidiphilus sp.]